MEKQRAHGAEWEGVNGYVKIFGLGPKKIVDVMQPSFLFSLLHLENLKSQSNHVEMHDKGSVWFQVN